MQTAENLSPAISTMQIVPTPELQCRTIYFQTNYNQKLACDAMVHVDLKPRNLPTHSEMEKILFEIRTSDNTYPPSTWKMYDMMFFSLRELNDILSFCSHGITAMNLCDLLFTQHQPRISWTTEVAVYFYLKFKV